MVRHFIILGLCQVLFLCVVDNDGNEKIDEHGNETLSPRWRSKSVNRMMEEIGALLQMWKTFLCGSMKVGILIKVQLGIFTGYDSKWHANQMDDLYGGSCIVRIMKRHLSKFEQDCDMLMVLKEQKMTI